jgi:predicted nucleotidyltransferase
VSVTPADTAATLQKRSAESRRQAETRAESVREQAVTIVRGLLAPRMRAWLIGSLAWGGFGIRSDVDMVLSGVDPERAGAIEDALLRALRVDVDLLVFEELPASFRDRIEREGIAIHGR